ncbi:MAG TPA: TIGR03668 family PPOX class F420-dependent oxidoreductase [Pseudonocardiaceae bacterium]|nr:TIGR03668 family PPOX class F420-dependent oxidoreductase [Pseudonocardiaceae bacterium]
MKLQPDEAVRRLIAADVARLATASAAAVPHIVAVTFAGVGGRIYIAIDRKPKSSTRLTRLRNIKQNPSVSLLVDHYTPDWEALWWARMDGRARVLEPGSAPDEAVGAFRVKYPQYREVPLDGPMIEIDPTRTTGWSYR